MVSVYTLGRIGEDVAKKKLVMDGFKISPISLHFCLNGCVRVFGPKRIKACPYSKRKVGCPKGGKWIQLMSYAYKVLKDKSWGINKKSRAIFFDSLVEKDGNEYLVEIKTNTARLTPWQDDLMKKARSLGYKTLLVKCFVKLSYKVNVEELV